MWITSIACAVVALPFQFVVHMCWDDFMRANEGSGHQKSRMPFWLRRYHQTYEMAQEPTGGSVDLTQNKDGTFKVVGFTPTVRQNRKLRFV